MNIRSSTLRLSAKFPSSVFSLHERGLKIIVHTHTHKAFLVCMWLVFTDRLLCLWLRFFTCWHVVQATALSVYLAGTGLCVSVSPGMAFGDRLGPRLVTGLPPKWPAVATQDSCRGSRTNLSCPWKLRRGVSGLYFGEELCRGIGGGWRSADGLQEPEAAWERAFQPHFTCCAQSFDDL